MGIIKLEVNLSEATRAIEQFKENRSKAVEAISQEIMFVVDIDFHHGNGTQDIFLS